MNKAEELLDLMGENVVQGSLGEGGASVIHTHDAEVDAEGNGETTSTSTGPDHDHKIENNKVIDAGEGPHGHPPFKKGSGSSDGNGDSGDDNGDDGGDAKTGDSGGGEE